MISVGDIVAVLRLKNELSPELRTAAKDVRGFGAETQRTLGDVTRAGVGLTAGLTVPIVGVGAAALKMSRDFNQSMANVATLIPGNVDRVNELKSTVQAMAIATGKSTDDLAGGLFQVLSAFGDTADSARILDINARAAAAGMATTEQAIALTSAVTKSYGDTSAEAVQKAADLAFKVNELGQTTFPELAASIGKVAPLTAQLKISQEELAATYATLTGVTGSAADVSTQFRAALVGLQNPSEAMQTALQGIGFATGEAALESLGFKGTLDALLQQQGGNVNSMIKLWGQTEAWAGVAALAGAQSGTFKDKLGAMSNAAGAAAVAFREQSSGVNAAGFALEQLKQQLVVLNQNIGDRLLPILLKATNTFSPLVDIALGAVEAFSNLPDPVQAGAIAVAGLAAAAGPALLAIGGLSTAITGLAGSAGLASVIALLGGSAGLVALIGTGAVVALSQMKGGLDDTQIALRGLRRETTLVTGEAGAFVTAFREAGLQGIREFGKQINPTLDQVRDLKGEMINLHQDGVIKTVDELESLVGVLTIWEKELVTATESTGRLRAGVVELPNGLRLVAAETEVVAADTRELVGEYDRLIARADGILEALRLKEHVLGQLALQTNEATEGLGEYDATVVATWPDVNSLNDAVRAARDAAGGFNAEFVASAPILDAFGNSVARGTGLLAGFTAGLSDLRKGLTGGNGISGLLQNVGAGIADGFGQILSGGLSSGIQWAVSNVLSGLGSLLGGLFGKTNAADEIAKQFGATLSAALTEEIQRIGDEHGRDYGAAFRLSLSKVIGEMGVDDLAGLQFFLQETLNLLADFDRGTISAAEATSAMQESLAALLPSFAALGQDLSVLTGPGGMLSDLVSRFHQGQISGEQLQAIFQMVANAAAELGIEGVAALQALAAEAGITIDVMSGLELKAQDVKAAYDEWQDAKKTVEELKAELQALKETQGANREETRKWRNELIEVTDTGSGLVGDLVPGFRAATEAIEDSSQWVQRFGGDVIAVDGLSEEALGNIIGHWNDVAEAAEAAQARQTAAVRSWMDAVNIDTSVTFKQIRDKWADMQAAMGLSDAVTKKLMQEELRALRDKTREILEQMADDAGLSEEEKAEFVRAGMKEAREQRQETARQARIASQEEARDARQSLQQQIKDARKVEREKREAFRETMRQIKAMFHEMGLAWSATIQQMILDGQSFEDEMVGNSVFPDTAKGARGAFKQMLKDGTSTFADLSKAGMLAEAGMTPGVSSSLGSGGLSALSASSSVTSFAAPASFASPSLSTSAPAASVRVQKTDTSGIESRLDRLEQAMRDQGPTIGRLVGEALQKHGPRGR